jgi:hypothetical protein
MPSLRRFLPLFLGLLLLAPARVQPPFRTAQGAPLSAFSPPAYVTSPGTPVTWAQHPEQAAVRIRSHGASGTVIASQPGKSWILSCAHMFLDEAGNPSAALRHKVLTLDGPPQPLAQTQERRPARLLAWDHHLDLSLIELDNGPFFFIPVAPLEHRPSPRLVSVGYDEMRWPVTIRPATLLGSDARRSYTREKPWHGRSGGGLIDLGPSETPCLYLLGVVQGYEVAPQGRGLYVSREAIWQFLRRHRPEWTTPQGPTARPCPPVPPSFGPQPIYFSPHPGNLFLPPPSSPCPGGVCPAPRPGNS